MEKQFRPYRKINTFFNPDEDRQLLSRQPEDQTKNTLIQLAEAQRQEPLKTKEINFNGWQNSNQNVERQSQSKHMPLFKKTVVIRSHYLSRKKDSIKSKNQNHSKSIIPKLKHLLSRLESPQKKKMNQKQAQGDYQELQKSIFGPKQSSRYRQSIRITNHSSEKKTRKVLVSRDKTQIKLNRSNQKELEEHLCLVREARRKRTLRNLLF